MPHNLGHMVYDYGHKWGNSYDNERVICMYCETSPLSSEAKEPCPTVRESKETIIANEGAG